MRDQKSEFRNKLIETKELTGTALETTTASGALEEFKKQFSARKK